MTFSKKITGSVIVLALLAISYIACNKDNNITSSTITKCVSCANGGSCINDTCRCPSGYTGTSCQTLAIDQFTGQWEVNETGTLTSQQVYTIFIQDATGSSLTSIIIQNLYEPYTNFSSVFQLTGNISGDSISIPSQAIDDSANIVGEGTYNLNTATGQATITFRYKVTNNYTHVVNDFGYNSSADAPSVWTSEP